MVGKSLDAAEGVARAFGLKSHAERRAGAPAAASSSLGAGAPAAAEPASAGDVAAADARLAACIAEAEARVAGARF